MEKEIFRNQPIRVIDGIYDFIEKNDDYVSNYDRIANDDLQERLMPDELKVLC